MPWAPGESGNRHGRPPKSIAAAIRRMTDGEAIAAVLNKIAFDPKELTANRLAAIKIIMDRAEGLPVATTVLQASMSLESSLPPDWGQMSAAERGRYLDGLAPRLLGSGDDDGGGS